MQKFAKTINTTPFLDQRPGTSGLRKKTKVFMQPHYLENFIQSVFDVLRQENPQGFENETLVLGGDGRYHNREALQTIVSMAAANGFGQVLIGRDGILSTPALSAVIKRRKAIGGFVLTASHNPGGPLADFGVKYNTRNGRPANPALTERIFNRSRQIERYAILEENEIDLSQDKTSTRGRTRVTIIDPFSDYIALMEELFDFEALRELFRQGFRLCFDAMHAVTGPYARHLFEHMLQAPSETVIRGTPLEDFGGNSPDPNRVHAANLVKRMSAAGGANMGAASDGDGDRNMILGHGLFVGPGDSLAIIADYAPRVIPGYRQGLRGIARSMPTSSAADRVAKAQGIPCYEMPTGWKYFAPLLEAGLCTLCGEESFGTGSSHLLEKDGLWAVLCWLSILAATGKSVGDVVREHWQRFGRSYFQRWDYESLDRAKVEDMLAVFRKRLPSLTGVSLAESRVIAADEFAYTNPITGRISTGHGFRILLEDQSRIVVRRSGTGTTGVTLRLYFERYSTNRTGEDLEDMLRPLIEEGVNLLELKARCGREEPTLIT